MSLGGALPRWRASGHVDWRRGPWLASSAAEDFGSITESVVDFPPFDIFFDPYTRTAASTLYHDIAGGYEFPTALTLGAAISNVTDEEPPFVNSGVPENTDAATYRLLGRTYLFKLGYRFQ